MTSSSLTHSVKKLPIKRRSFVFIVATLLLHVLAWQSTGWKDWSASTSPGTENMITVSMRTMPNAVTPAAIIASPDKLTDAPEPETKVVKKNAPAILHEPDSPIETAPGKITAVLPTENESPPATVLQEEASKEATAPATELAPGDTADAVTHPDQVRYAIRAPESVQIAMTLVRTKPDSNPTYGVGSIYWEVSNGKYNMRIEAGIDMLITSINLYKLSSEGRLDSFGITPDISTEARLTRASTATHFNYEDKTIRFSSSSKTVAMSDGAQDKASFLMQLAAIGYADERQFIPGQEIRLQVAEERDATQFQFMVSGKEEIQTTLGTILTWHLVRAPRPGSYNSQLDIWLAPTLGWYPVQIRNTESNGTVTLQTATKINQKLNAEN
ncbi:MAG: DUF3108 domain-containing protein [Undibacterium sp.]|nr:DUF3108 domain-containing protein [Undibacterium sp.]